MVLVNDKLKGFASAMLRNKVVFSTDVVDGLGYVNIGRALSEALSGLEESSLTLKAADILKSLILQSASQHDLFGKYIALDNIGILFEPDMHINIEQLFQSVSTDAMLFLCSQHTIIDDCYLFMNSQECKVRLQTLSYISM